MCWSVLDCVLRGFGYAKNKVSTSRNLPQILDLAIFGFFISPTISQTDTINHQLINFRIFWNYKQRHLSWWWSLLAKHYYLTLGCWHHNSVCHLLCCCTLLRELIFSTISLHHIVAYHLARLWRKQGKDNYNSFSSQGYYVQGSMKKSRFSTYISLHLANNRRYGNSYNGRQIENRMSSIGQCHFQWPWMTPNSDFLLPSRLNMYTSRNIWLSNLPISSCYKYDVFSAKNMVWQVPVITKRSFCLSCYMHLRRRLY